MEFHQCSHFHQFDSYFTLCTNKLFFSFKVLKNSAQYFSVSALSFHFENEPSIDVVRSVTPQTIRNYDYDKYNVEVFQFGNSYWI